MEGIKMKGREINTNNKTIGNYLQKKIIIREKLSQITWIVILTWLNFRYGPTGSGTVKKKLESDSNFGRK